MPGLTGVYVGPADLAISLGIRTGRSVDRTRRSRRDGANPGDCVGGRAGGRDPRQHGNAGKAMAEAGFRMITLASESQALRRGAADAPLRGDGGASRHDGRTDAIGSRW